MTAERDTTRIVRSWLRTDEHESADRVLETVLARLDTTPQRRPTWLPRRSTTMPTYAKLALAAAALVVVAVAGYNLLPKPGPGPANPTIVPPTTQPSPTDAAIPVPSPNHLVEIPQSFGQQVSLTLPLNWRAITQEPGRYDFGEPAGSYLGIFIITDVYKDPCHPEAGLQDKPYIGQMSGSDAAAALRSMRDFHTGLAQDSTSGLWTVTHFRITNDIDTDAAACTNGGLLPIFNVAGTAEAVSTNGGTTLEFWVHGLRGGQTQNFVVVAELGEGPGAADQSVIDAIVASIRP